MSDIRNLCPICQLSSISYGWCERCKAFYDQAILRILYITQDGEKTKEQCGYYMHVSTPNVVEEVKLSGCFHETRVLE